MGFERSGSGENGMERSSARQEAGDGGGGDGLDEDAREEIRGHAAKVATLAVGGKGLRGTDS